MRCPSGAYGATRLMRCDVRWAKRGLEVGGAHKSFGPRQPMVSERARTVTVSPSTKRSGYAADRTRVV